MKEHYYLELLKRKELFLKELNEDLKRMYAIPFAWDAGWVARCNARIFEFNSFVRKHNPTREQSKHLFINIVLLGSHN